jgi:regulator of ribonuclease activity B
VPLFGGDKRDLQDPADAEVVERLRKEGVDLRAPLEIRHVLSFDTEGAARRAALEFGESPEWRVEVGRAADGPQWLFSLTHRAVVDLAAIKKLRSSFGGLAERNGGRYDGWEAGPPS